MSLYPDGYRMLGLSFTKYGFDHRQGSGYISKSKLDSDQVNDIVAAIVTENPWLIRCAKRIDVTDIGRQHDLTALLQGFENMNEELDELPKLTDEISGEDNGLVPKM